MTIAPIKTRLLLPEYGRNVQKMVRYLSTIEDRDERNKQAQIVIATMANVYPDRRETTEFRNMLYDHLFMIADFELDIDCPFEKPSPDQFSPVPEILHSTQHYVVQKQYGATVPRLAKEVASIQDEAMRRAAATNLARFMRQKSYDYNKEYPNDDIIISDLFDMTNGAIRLDASVFEGSQITQRPQNRNINNRNNNNNQRGNKNSNNSTNNNNNNRNRKKNTSNGN